MYNTILNEDFALEVSSIESVNQGSFILRENGKNIQLARFDSLRADGALILSNVVDITNCEFVADAGLLHLQRGDRLFTVNSVWESTPAALKAAEIITSWALFSRHKNLQKQIIELTKNTFPPSVIIWMQKNDSLKQMFIPMQQKLQIGKFEVKNKWEFINEDRFKTIIESLVPNEYITYMGYLPQAFAAKPMFYSAGTETHLETDLQLKKEPFLYPTNCGGNIKLLKEDGENKYYLVDAGSSYKGNGVNSRMDEARTISRHLKKIYPNHHFIPVEGRGAMGSKFCF